MGTQSVAILGATGYAGVELVRLVAAHPRLELAYATSEQYVGRTLASVYPFLGRHGRLPLEELDVERAVERAEIVFTSLPHGAAAASVAAIVERGRKVVDLSADFRLHDRAAFERTYKVQHAAPALLERAVFGLTEFHRDEIARATLVANPGCYPTGALLGLLPLVTPETEIESVIVDAKSGASGAGRAAKTELLFCEVDENLRAYEVGTHRHAPEIEQEVRLAARGAAPPVFFAPHLIPVVRGILSTIYVRCRVPSRDRLAEIFTHAYRDAPCVDVCADGTLPELRDVRGTNRCAIGWRADPEAGMVVVVSAIDNLLKGAAGQAVQNLNVMMGWEEDLGLDGVALVP